MHNIFANKNKVLSFSLVLAVFSIALSLVNPISAITVFAQSPNSDLDISTSLIQATPTPQRSKNSVTPTASPTKSPVVDNSDKLNKYSGPEATIIEYLCTPSKDDNSQDLNNCIQKIYRFGVTIGALTLVFFIVVAGYMYITGGESGKARGKSMIVNTVVGMAILLGSYLLLNFVNPNLTILKPIQPPIFGDPKLPDCDGLGFKDCLISIDPGESSDSSLSTPGTPTNKYANCSNIVNVKGIPRASANMQICESLLAKLQTSLTQFTNQNPSYYFAVTSTVRNRNAESDCHYSNKPVSGNCADIGMRKDKDQRVPVTNTAWSNLCKIFLANGLYLANETGVQQLGCPNPKKYQNTNGPHFHVFIPG